MKYTRWINKFDPMAVTAAWVLCLGIGAFAAGCDEGAISCAVVDSSCAPLYEPTFDNVFSNTIIPSCAPEGTSCHSLDGRKGGLAYDPMDPGGAYELLLGNVDGRARVVAFDAECSPMVKRIATPSESALMPPGNRLGTAERCAIEKWIAAGAER